MKRNNFLPFAQPDIDDTELTEVKEALLSGWVTTGPKTKQFESEFAEYIGVKHAIAVNSCTAAMHLALDAIGLEEGDWVITSPYTFAATAEVVRYFKAEPVFVDIDPLTFNIDPEQLDQRVGAIKKKKGGRLKAVIPVHIGGNACEMDPIQQIAREHDLVIIEDAAHALPTKYKGRMVGTPFSGPGETSSFTCFSFYATKSITTGEGGMITTDNDQWAERCRIMSLHGISKDAWKRYTAEGSWYYEIIAPGYKYNMTDVAAAMGLAQLRKIEQMWKRRLNIAQQYSSEFDMVDELQSPTPGPRDGQHAWHLYSLRLNLNQLSIDRNQFMEKLRESNIGASVHFIPLHIHPYYKEVYHYQPDDFPIAYQEYQRVISLPIYSKMTDQDVADVINAVLEIVRNNRK